MEAEKKDSTKRQALLFFLGIALFIAVYTLFFVGLQLLLFDHKGTFLFSGPNYGGVVFLIASVQSPLGVILLSQLFKREKPSIILWIVCGVLTLPAILLLPVYRSVDATGVHKSQFYGVERTVPWSQLNFYSFDVHNAMRGIYGVHVEFDPILNPSQPIVIKLPVSDAGAESALQIQATATQHHVHDSTYKYPSGSHVIPVLASLGGNVWSEFVYEEFTFH